MKIGTKVVEKAKPRARLMTVTLITPEAHVVYTWQNPTTGKMKERMFFPQMLEEQKPDR